MTSPGQYRPIVQDAKQSSYSTRGGTHGGFPAADIFADIGKAIWAPVGGIITAATYPQGGNSAILHGDDGLYYYFAHANKRMASGRVVAGDQIGEVGNSGNAQYTSPHLHFAIAASAALFDQRNGSGDRDISSTYWEGGTADPGTPAAPLPPPAGITIPLPGPDNDITLPTGGDIWTGLQGSIREKIAAWWHGLVAKAGGVAAVIATAIGGLVGVTLIAWGLLALAFRSPPAKLITRAGSYAPGTIGTVSRISGRLQ